jgi:hypothetical protein
MPVMNKKITIKEHITHCLILKWYGNCKKIKLLMKIIYIL